MSKAHGRWDRWALPILIGLAIVIRFGTFFPTVINHDESTYILIGQQLWEGQTYLVDAIDTKPIGIFLIYALLHAITGGSIFAMRLLVAGIVGLTGFLLFLMGKRIGGHYRVGWLSGIGYVFMVSIFTFYGISPNTELFFIPLVLTAFLLAWPRGQGWWAYLLAGLLLGCGFVIKYVVAADALALGLILLFIGWQHKRLATAIFDWCLPLTLAFFIPIALVYGYYWSIGMSEQFWFYSFEVTKRYPVDATTWQRTKYMLDFLLRYTPFVVLAVLALREFRLRDRTWQAFTLLWFACCTAILLIPGKFFGHYQIQLMPALVCLAASWAHPDRHSLPGLRHLSPKLGYSLLAVLSIGLTMVLMVYYGQKPDRPKEAAVRLQSMLQPGEEVYLGNYHQIIYHLLDQAPPTPYVHSTLLLYDHHIEALAIDLERETRNLIDKRQPRFVLLRAGSPDNHLTQAIYNNYIIQDTLPDRVYLLERKTESR